MQRPIKFRAWDKSRKHMFQPAWSFEKRDDGPIHQEIHVFGGFSFDELMQFTGLKDKNGREIYEGDILEVDNDSDIEKTKHEVVWGGTHYPAFHLKPSLDSECNDFSEISESGYYEIKIIGNIYENPELVKSERSNR